MRGMKQFYQERQSVLSQIESGSLSYSQVIRVFLATPSCSLLHLDLIDSLLRPSLQPDQKSLRNDILAFLVHLLTNQGSPKSRDFLAHLFRCFLANNPMCPLREKSLDLNPFLLNSLFLSAKGLSRLGLLLFILVDCHDQVILLESLLMAANSLEPQETFWPGLVQLLNSLSKYMSCHHSSIQNNLKNQEQLRLLFRSLSRLPLPAPLLYELMLNWRNMCVVWPAEIMVQQIKGINKSEQFQQLAGWEAGFVSAYPLLNSLYWTAGGMCKEKVEWSSQSQEFKKT